MNRSKGRLSFTAVAAVAALTFAAGASAQAWKPTKPITIIVPWAAGGATDQVTRLLAAELEPSLGQKIVVVNQPGASGSIGTKNTWEAAKDGYTWTAGAPKQLGTYKLLGMFDTAVTDWHLYVGVTITPVISVNPSSQIQDMGQFLAALKARPNAVTVATAGATSSGHIAMEAIVGATGLTYRHVTYDGGNPAVVATVAGETEATSQLATEQARHQPRRRIGVDVLRLQPVHGPGAPEDGSAQAHPQQRGDEIALGGRLAFHACRDRGAAADVGPPAPSRRLSWSAWECRWCRGRPWCGRRHA